MASMEANLKPSGLPPLARTVIIDYYDSYTNNLLTLFTKLYSDTEVLAKIAVIKADKYTWAEFQSTVLPNVDCIIISPGPGRPDTPKDIGFALDLLRLHPVPILGVCLGHQAIAVAFGGKIVNTPKITHGHVTRVRPVIPARGLFASSQWTHRGAFDVVVYNSLTVDPSSIPDELEVTAWSEPVDSTPTVQGLAHKSYPIWGVQYHPESISSTHGVDLISAFIHAVHNHHHSPTSYPPLPEPIIAACAYRVSSLSTSAKPSATDVVNDPERIRLELVERRFGSSGRELKTQELFERVVRRCAGGERKGKRREAIGEVWLDGENPSRSTTTSLATPSFLLSYSLSTRTVTLHRPAHSSTSLTLPPSQTFWSWFDAGQRALSASLPAPSSHGSSPPLKPKERGWQGGWVGWFGYEMKAESLVGYDPATLPRASLHEDRADAAWAWVDEVVERAPDGEWVVRGVLQEDTATGDESTEMVPWLLRQGVRFGATREEHDDLLDHVQHVLCTSSISGPANGQNSIQELNQPATAFPRFHPSIKGELHKSRIDACREAIRQGESYELNQTTSFIATLDSESRDHKGMTASAYALYLRLRSFNPAYYSAYIAFPTLRSPHGVGYHVLSSSPERFLQITSDTMLNSSSNSTASGLGGSTSQVIEMRPIKGTRARVKPGQCVCGPGQGCEQRNKGSEVCRAYGREEDEKRGKELSEDLKERAENLMIVDLIRSDLLSCCTLSTVSVPQLIALESYGVHNLVTTVKGELASGIGAVEAVRRCFPPGSMTGAPKLRSVQLLDGFEEGAARGIYSGALGYLSLGGDADLSVVIRTIVAEGNRLSIGAGGAITWLSDRDGEWDEVLTKVQSVVGPLDGVE